MKNGLSSFVKAAFGLIPWIFFFRKYREFWNRFTNLKDITAMMCGLSSFDKIVIYFLCSVLSLGYTPAALPTTAKTNSSFYKQQTPSGSTGSLPQLAKAASTTGAGAGHVKNTGREGELLGASPPVTGTVGSTSSVIFHLGDRYVMIVWKNVSTMLV